MKRIAALVALLFLSAGCSSTAVIKHKLDKKFERDMAIEQTRQACYASKSNIAHGNLTGTDLALVVMGKALAASGGDSCAGSTNSADVEIAASEEKTKRMQSVVGLAGTLVSWGTGAYVGGKIVEALGDARTTATTIAADLPECISPVDGAPDGHPAQIGVTQNCIQK